MLLNCAALKKEIIEFEICVNEVRDVLELGFYWGDYWFTAQGDTNTTLKNKGRLWRCLTSPEPSQMNTRQRLKPTTSWQMCSTPAWKGNKNSYPQVAALCIHNSKEETRWATIREAGKLEELQGFDENQGAPLEPWSPLWPIESAGKVTSGVQLEPMDPTTPEEAATATTDVQPTAWHLERLHAAKTFSDETHYSTTTASS